jgi:AmmeMemoRadiSam system protein A
MSETDLSQEEKQILLRLARQTLEAGRVPDLSSEDLPPDLCENGASFVTLTTRDGDLRGCIGALEAYQPLVIDVCEHALAAAREDYRFPPVRLQELPHIVIEISCLTAPTPLEYRTPDELVGKLRPGIDGVTLHDGPRRATFLPQVWQKLPAPQEFLDHLCLKMGSPASLWRQRLLRVETYQVEEFHE